MNSMGPRNKINPVNNQGQRSVANSLHKAFARTEAKYLSGRPEIFCERRERP
jgi:hypothetical protein